MLEKHRILKGQESRIIEAQILLSRGFISQAQFDRICAGLSSQSKLGGTIITDGAVSSSMRNEGKISNVSAKKLDNRMSIMSSNINKMRSDMERDLAELSNLWYGKIRRVQEREPNEIRRRTAALNQAKDMGRALVGTQTAVNSAIKKHNIGHIMRILTIMTLIHKDWSTWSINVRNMSAYPLDNWLMMWRKVGDWSKDLMRV